MAFLVLLLLLISIIFSMILIQKHYKSKGYCGNPPPPGPKGLPIIGNIHQLDISKLHLSLAKLSKTCGPLISLNLCQKKVIVISSADVAQKALKHNDIVFSGRPFTTASFRFSYGNKDIITSPYTEYWREMRKMVVHHLFSPQKVRSFRPLREEQARLLTHQISNKVGQCVDVGDMVMAFSRRILCRVAFGRKMDVEEGGRISILDEPLASTFETMMEDCFPLFGWINKICGVSAKLDKRFKDLDSFYQQLIDEHLSPNRPDCMDKDILDLLIQLKHDHSAPVKIDWNHIKAILMNVFTAGTDTVAATIIWTLTALMNNPSEMQKVQQEIRSLVGMKGFTNEDDIENLPYLKAVIKETMRLYPAIPLVPKETLANCIINDYEIKNKTLVFLNIWAIGRDPEYWDDPEDFLPARFLNNAINFVGQDFGFIPFGAGRRICPGIHLGVSTVELALANLLYSFDWEIPQQELENDIDTDSSIGLVMRKKNPLCLVPISYA